MALLITYPLSSFSSSAIGMVANVPDAAAGARGGNTDCFQRIVVHFNQFGGFLRVTLWGLPLFYPFQKFLRPRVASLMAHVKSTYVPHPPVARDSR